MPITTAQTPVGVDDGGNDSTTVVSLGSAPTTGNLLVAVFSTYYGSTAISSVSGGGVTTWALAKSQANGSSARTEIWYGYVDTTPDSTVTGTWGAKLNGNKCAWLAEFAGTATASPVDVTGSTTGSGTTASSGTADITDAGDVCVGSYGANSSLLGDSTPGTGWVVMGSSPQTRGEAAYKIQTSIETASASWAMGNTRTYAGAIVAMFPAATAAAGYDPLGMLGFFGL